MRLDHTTIISDHVRPSPVEAARQLTPGSLLAGRYRLVGPVGSGGMGVVYRAEDIKIGQTVALKFIPPAVADDPELVARLVAEVRVGRQVAHPNVCRLYDIVESDGQHFMAMEFVDGEDLSSLLRRVGRLPVAKALDVARDV